MWVQVFMTSGRDLKNVNWRNGLLKPYAVVWIDSSRRCSTKVDQDNGVNPVWNEKFTIPLPSTSRPESAILHIDVVNDISHSNTRSLIGSVKLPLSVVLIEAHANGKVACSLELKRPSGRPQGVIEIKIGIKDQNISPRDQAVQPSLKTRPMSQRVEPQRQDQSRAKSQPLPKAQFFPQAQPQLQPSSWPMALLPQAQFYAKPQAQFQPSSRPMAPSYRPGYRHVGPSATQICNLGLNLAFGGLPVKQILRHMDTTNYHNNLKGNNNSAALRNAKAYFNGQLSNGGYDGYGSDAGGQLGNGSVPDMNGLDNNGCGIDLSGFGNGSVPDLSGMGGRGVDFDALMADGGIDFGGLMGGLMGGF